MDQVRAERDRQDRLKMEALLLRDFPPHFLDPWKSRVALAELPPGDGPWEAGMRPLCVSGDEPIFFMRRSGPCDSMHSDTRYHVEIVGPDQDDVLARAYAFVHYATSEF